MRQKRPVKQRPEKTEYFDYSLLCLTIFIVLFGVVMIYSASSYNASVVRNDAFFFVKSQLKGILLGIIAILAITKMNYRSFMKKIPLIRLNVVQILFLVSIFLQIFVLFTAEDINGAKRWISLGPIQFQPSEISKVATILMVAYMVYKAPKAINHPKGFIRVVLIHAPLLALIAKENLSTALIIVMIIGLMCFIASKKKGYFVLMGLGIGAIVALYILLGDPFRQQRFQIWLDPESHEKGFQTMQALYAIASGGMFGTGLGQSMQKLGFIPESQNDMIFSIICEEMGLVGAGVVIFMYILLLWRIMTIANHAPDLFGGMICTGVMIQIGTQVLLNVAVVSNAIPSTGVSLPFISCGGTSVAILLAEIGLVLCVSKKI